VKQADLILAGGGLANTLIALRLADSQPQLNVMLLERGDHIGGNHTWSFHGSDLNQVQRDWIKPLIEYSWDRYEVRFPGGNRTLTGTYNSITSEGLSRTARARLGDSIHTDMNITDLGPESVGLDDGTQIQAAAVIDGRGPRASAHLDVRFQKFVGRIVTVDRPHGLAGPIIMDATQDQDDGYRFFYTLPFDAQTLLIEDTRYSDSPMISAGEYGDEISRYAATQGWQITEVLREEEGVLPITLGGDIGAFWDDSRGMVGGPGLRSDPQGQRAALETHRLLSRTQPHAVSGRRPARAAARAGAILQTPARTDRTLLCGR